MELREFNELFKKYEAGTLSDDERRLLEKWYNQYATESKGQAGHTELEERLKSIAGKIPVSQRATKIRRMYYRIAAAASILIALSAGTWWFYHQDATESRLVQNDIAPGGNRATLTLAGGKTIALSEARSGIIVGDGITYADGTAVFSDSLQSERLNTQYSILMSISTPRGGQYQVVLPDGTKVWLNANSTLRYPVRFTSSERIVELVGEAYFDVKSDKNKPFKVINEGQEVVVLGTQFNITAYPGDPEIKTTLVEGSVRLWANAYGTSMSLVPGEQGALKDGTFTKSEADIEAVIAWKNGLFVFNNNLRHTLAQISRWYDVEIEYQDPIGDDLTLIGKVSRNMELSSLLGYIEEASGNNVHFTLTERRVIVRK